MSVCLLSVCLPIYHLSFYLSLSSIYLSIYHLSLSSIYLSIYLSILFFFSSSHWETRGSHYIPDCQTRCLDTYTSFRKCIDCLVNIELTYITILINLVNLLNVFSIYQTVSSCDFCFQPRWNNRTRFALPP